MYAEATMDLEHAVDRDLTLDIAYSGIINDQLRG